MDWKECKKHNIQTIQDGYKYPAYTECPVCRIEAENDSGKVGTTFPQCEEPNQINEIIEQADKIPDFNSFD